MKKRTTLTLDTPRWAYPLLGPLGSKRYRAAYGGRGSGKSHFFAGAIIEQCLLKKTNVVCVREFQMSLQQSVKRLMESLIQKYKVGHLFEVQKAQIKAPHGGLIIFQGMQDHNSDSIKSLEGFDVAWIEEAQSLSQQSLDLLRPTIRSPNSEIWATWNPRYETDPIDVLLRGEDPPPDSIAVSVNFDDNPWFPDVLRVEMEFDRKRNIDKYQHVWRGGYRKNSEARVFKHWTIEEFTAPDDVFHRFGADWGFSVDPTTLVRNHTVGRKLYIDYEAYQIGCEITSIPSLFLTIPEAEKWPIVADSGRPDTISHMRNNGFPKIYGAVKGKGSIEDGVEWLKTFDIVVHPRCIHTIDELTLYSYKVDKNTGAVLPILEDKNNHIIDALRYSQEGARRAGKPTRPTSTIPVRINNPCATYLRRN